VQYLVRAASVENPSKNRSFTCRPDSLRVGETHFQQKGGVACARAGNHFTCELRGVADSPNFIPLDVLPVTRCPRETPITLLKARLNAASDS
jgi:hypothetical protein